MSRKARLDILGHFFNLAGPPRLALSLANGTDTSRNNVTLNHWFVGSIPTRCMPHYFLGNRSNGYLRINLFRISTMTFSSSLMPRKTGLTGDHRGFATGGLLIQTTRQD